MAIKPEQHPALTHQQRIQRLQQLTTDLARAVDLAEEQRRMLRDIARDASDLADALGAEAAERRRDAATSPARGRRPAKRR